jgi:hypothetical protein
MIDFFTHFREKMQRENIGEDAIANFFAGLRGIVILDTLGESNKNKEDIEKMQTGLAILETREIGLENLKQILLEAMEKCSQKSAQNNSV